MTGQLEEFASCVPSPFLLPQSGYLAEGGVGYLLVGEVTCCRRRCPLRLLLTRFRLPLWPTP